MPGTPRAAARTTVVRPARVGDAEAIARIYVESWQSTYPGLLPDRLLSAMRADGCRQRSWRSLIAGQGPADRILVAAAGSAAGPVLGFASGGAARRGGLGHAAEIQTLYVDDDARGCGIGRALMVRMAGVLADCAGPSLIVWVLAGNPARFFYEALGGRLVARRPGTLGGQAIEELAYGWADSRMLFEPPPA